MPINSSSTSPPATIAPRRGGRLAALDGLRLVAALFVVIYHYAGPGEPHLWRRPEAVEFPGLHQVATYGWLGVQLFFIISGFVICMSSWDRSLKDFFVSRTTRLFPMYWAAVILSAAVIYSAAPIVKQLSVVRRPSSVADLLLNLTMGQNAFQVLNVDGVYWTLWVELRFYLLFAVVVWKGVTYRRALSFCALWLIASVVTATINEPLVQTIVQPSSAPYFIAGILLYLIHRFGSTPLLWGMVGFCWLLAEKQVSSETMATNQILHVSMQWRYSALLVTLFFVAVSAVALGWLRWAKWRWLTIAGACTYPLYLLHQDIGLVIIRGLRDTVAKWPLLIGTILLMLVVAYLGHRLIERPVAPRLKRMLVRSLNLDPRPRIPAGRQPEDEAPAAGTAPPPANGVHAPGVSWHGLPSRVPEPPAAEVVPRP